jgi:hypothetical protein
MVPESGGRFSARNMLKRQSSARDPIQLNRIMG